MSTAVARGLAACQAAAPALGGDGSLPPGSVVGGLLEDGKPSPFLGPGRPVAFVYVDNANI
eukprot:16206271-Heterocapsa_arctica.AAC.1